MTKQKIVAAVRPSRGRIKTSKLEAKLVPYSEIEALFKNVLNVQRDHQARAMKAKHIGRELFGNQLVFSASRKGTEVRLTDGYTRCEKIAEGEVDRPDYVLLVIFEARDEEQSQAIYDQFDSKEALKKGSDRFQEGLRYLGKHGTLTSNMVIKGPHTSAISHATGIKSTRQAIIVGYEGVAIVDSYGLKKEQNLTVGSLAAFFAIAQHVRNEPFLIEGFIRRMCQVRFNPESEADSAIVTARKIIQARREQGSNSGGTNVGNMMVAVLRQFAMYYDLKKTPARASTKAKAYTDFSLGRFKLWAEKLAA